MDVDTIMTAIREEARARRENRGGLPAGAGPGIAPIRAAIAEASRNANAGELTPMEEFHGPKRTLALLAGRMIVYLLSFITVRQRLYNAEVLSALRLQTDALETLAREQEALRCLLRDREETIAALERELERVRAGAGREAGNR